MSLTSDMDVGVAVNMDDDYDVSDDVDEGDDMDAKTRMTWLLMFHSKDK